MGNIIVVTVLVSVVGSSMLSERTSYRSYELLRDGTAFHGVADVASSGHQPKKKPNEIY